MNMRKLLAATCAAVAVAVLTGVLINLGDESRRPAGDGTRAAPLAGPSTRATSREFFNFEDLDTMVATSSLVVEGTVIALEPGRQVGEGHDQEGYTNAILRIEEVLAGSTSEKTLAIEELTSAAGSPIVLDGVEWSRVGDQGIYFLRRKPGDLYTLISSQGRYLESGDGRLKGANEQDALVKALSQLDRDTVKAEVRRGKRAVDSGSVDPLPYPPGLEKID